MAAGQAPTGYSAMGSWQLFLTMIMIAAVRLVTERSGTSPIELAIHQHD